MYDFKFEITENQKSTITTHTSQHVEFFHSLIFYFYCKDNANTMMLKLKLFSSHI